MCNDFVPVCEDMPQLDKGRKRVTIPIDVLLENGQIMLDCFATVDDERFYNGNGKRVHGVVGWRTRV